MPNSGSRRRRLNNGSTVSIGMRTPVCLLGVPIPVLSTALPRQGSRARGGGALRHAGCSGLAAGIGRPAPPLTGVAYCSPSSADPVLWMQTGGRSRGAGYPLLCRVGPDAGREPKRRRRPDRRHFLVRGRNDADAVGRASGDRVHAHGHGSRLRAGAGRSRGGRDQGRAGGRRGDRGGRRAGSRAPGMGFFAMLNRNKRSFCRRHAFARGPHPGQGAAPQRGDVLIENFQPASTSSVSAYETLRADNPRLIYCSCKGFLPDPMIIGSRWTRWCR